MRPSSYPTRSPLTAAVTDDRKVNRLQPTGRGETEESVLDLLILDILQANQDLPFLALNVSTNYIQIIH